MDITQKLSQKFIDVTNGEPVPEGAQCIEFMMRAVPDSTLTDGGVIEKRSPKVREIQKLERERLTALRLEHPFEEAEPQPSKDQSPAAQREYKQAHDDWDARRLSHDEDLKEKARMLHDHHESKDLYVVTPAGRPIFVDREYIQLWNPGDIANIACRPVTQDDIQRHRQQYEKWKAGQEQTLSGTPLAQWPGVTLSQVAELAYFGIKTVEQLAAVSDANLARVGTYTATRQKARDWLDTARGAAPVEAVRAENKRLADEMAELKRQMAEMVKAQDSRGNGGGNSNQQRR